jgi:CHAT domain
MTNRTVITFHPAGRSVFVSVDRAPIFIAPDTTKVNLAKIVETSLVERGKAIYAAIAARDPVRASLENAFRMPAASEPAPLYFHIRASAADVIEWEQIYTEEHGFCALDARWPVGRIASTVTQVEGQAFVPPLKLVAVLAAAGREGKTQLDALLAATSASALPTELHVITGDEAVASAAQAAGAGTEVIAGTSVELRKQIAAAQPKILHIFCHGGMVANEHVLAFASTADEDAEVADEGSIRVFAKDLVDTLVKRSNPWLVVLNACETGPAAGGAIAHAMVDAGVTAVIGMRRKIEIQNADKFCRLLYPEVLGIVERALQTVQADPNRTDAVLDWAPALTAPRQAMSGLNPGDVDVWLDPVLYAQHDDLRISPRKSHMDAQKYARLQGERDKLVDYLANLDAATAETAVIEAVRSRIAAIDVELAASGEDASGP